MKTKDTTLAVPDMVKPFTHRVFFLKDVFGLTNWEIQVVYKEGNIHNCETLADPRYYRATITVYPSALNNTKEWDLIIIHELIHVVMALYDFYADNLGKEGSQELLYISREHSVSQLTHIFMRLYGRQTN